MSDSRRSKSKKSKRSKHSHYEDDSYSDDSLSGSHHSSQEKERRRRRSYSPDSGVKSLVRSYSSEKTRMSTNSPQLKSLVKQPIPSLLSPPPLLSSGSRGYIKEAKVVQNKAGKNRKAKSLMDIHFEDRSLRTPVYQRQDERRKSDKMPTCLLPDPYERPLINVKTPAERREEDDHWLTPKESKRTLKKRSWRESGGGVAQSHSLFSSNYKPLVIESEPKKKVQKLDKSLGRSEPRSLLESKILLSNPSHSTQVSSLVPRDSSGDSRSRSSNEDHSAIKTSDIIVSFESAAEKGVVYLVIPSTLPWVHLHGRAKIQVVKGSVFILAHMLVPGTSYDVFSPSSNCLLSLQTDAGDVCMSPRDVKFELKKLVKSSSEFGELSDKSIGIIKMTKLQSVVCDYVTRLPPFTKLFFPRPAPRDWSSDRHPLGVTLLSNTLKVAPDSEMCDPCMAWDDLYNDALDKWLETIDKGAIGSESPVLVTCGAKGAGKSTFNRCAINTTLRSVPEVAFIDCDVGQTEFSPPATVSLHIIQKPVLSPPFCHQRHAEKMVFFGDVTPANDPTLYIKCLRYCYQAYSTLADGKKLPLIVNTMGFPEGVGYMLFIDTLNITRPDLVIQFNIDQPHSNFPAVNQEMVALDEGWTFNKTPPPDFKERLAQVKEHFLFMLPSLNFTDKTVVNPIKLHPADFRNLSMFSALSMGLSDQETLMSLTPHLVTYNHLAIHVCRYNLAPEEILLAIDASVVALCEADLTQAKSQSEESPLTFDDMPICDCLGLGIVRSVDTDKRLLYICTTIPRHLLKRVNTILKGVLALPDHFIMNQKNIRHQVPYIDVMAQATATHGLRPRSRMPRIQAKVNNYFGL